MPKKQNIPGPARFVSRKQQDRQSRQRKIRSLVIAVVSVVIVAVLGVVGWSVYNFQVKPYRQPVVTFNGETLDMRYFVNTLKLYYGQAPTDTSIGQFADYVEQQIEQNETIIQGARALGIQIDAGDIEQTIRDAGLKATRERVDVVTAQQLVSRQVPASQPQYHVQAMLLESEAAGQAALARLRAGEPFGDVAQAVSKVSTDTLVGGDLGWVTPREADLAAGSTGLGDLIAGTANGTSVGPVYDATVSKLFGYWVARAVERQDATDNLSVDRMHLAGLLLGSEPDALDVIAQLDAGADIDALAKQRSQIAAAAENGADIGWISRGQDPGGLGQVFDLPLGTVVGPISENLTATKGGWWVLNIADTDANRALTRQQQDKLQQDFIDSCAAALQKDPNYRVANLLTPEMRDFALDQVVSSLGKGAVLIATTDLPDGEAGLPYSFRLKAYGDTGGAVWSVEQGALPEGLSLDPGSGVISGTPVTAGGGGVTVKVATRVHHDTVDLVFRVRLPVSVATTSLPDGEVGAAYNALLEAFGDSDTYTWSVVAGSLPDGIQLSASGFLQGVPTSSGTAAFTVQVDDGMRQATRDFTITVP